MMRKNASLVAVMVWKGSGVSEQFSVTWSEFHIRALEV